MSHTTSSSEPWLQALLAVAKHYRLDYSEENVRVSINWTQDAEFELLLEDMARQMGLAIKFDKFELAMLDPWRMPLVVEFSHGQIGVLEKMDQQGNVSVVFSGDNGLATVLTAKELASRIQRMVIHGH